MSGRVAKLIVPPSTLEVRACDVDGGATLEDLHTTADAIVARIALSGGARR